MKSEPEARTSALAERLTELRERSRGLPGGSLLAEVLQNERDRGGVLIAGGVAFRVFLWVTPLGLVVAAVLSLWREHDPVGIESAAQNFGVGAAAAQSAGEALAQSDRNIAVVFAIGLVALMWFTLGALRALYLAYALAWRLERPRLRRPFRAIVAFNGIFGLAILSSFGVAALRDEFGRSALLGVGASLAALTGVALLAMWLLPHRAARPLELLPGAFLVAAGHQLLQIVVLFYFAPRLGESQETYGAFGAAATMLIWLYVLSRLVTGGAFLNATLWSRRHAGETVAEAPARELRLTP